MRHGHSAATIGAGRVASIRPSAVLPEGVAIRRRRILRAALAAATLAAGGALAGHAAAVSEVVVSEVYGGGGNSGATLTNDYVELLNRSGAPIAIDGWSVQYASATGTTWQVTPLSGAIAPGGRHLVQQAAGTGGTTPLPAPDSTGAIAMSATNGKVALSTDATALSGAAPAALDLVGYGTANGFEGSAAAPGLSNTTAALRGADGCTDTDQNGADFTAGTPEPENSAAAAVDCSAPPPPPPPPTITPIDDIQGAGASSPLVGREVTISGVVTGVDDEIGASTSTTFPIDAGIFVQEVTPDGDPATSDGVFVGFVRDRGAYPPGTLVRTTGVVREQFGHTIVSESFGLEPELLGTAPVPAPVEIDPAAAAAQGAARAYYESLEGMNVRLAVGTANSGGTSKFGELFLTPGTTRDRVFRDDAAPDLLATDADAGAGDPDNPFRPEAPSTTLVRADLFDRVSDVVGPLAFSFSNFKIMVQPGRLPAVADGPTPFPFVLPRPRLVDVQVATINLENYLPVGAELDLGTVTPEEYAEKRNRLADAIGRLLRRPEVVVVQEAGDITVLEDLANRIGGYRAFLAEGNDNRGIDVGILVRRSPLIRADNLRQLGKEAPNPTTATCSDVAGRLFDRPPLALDIAALGVRFTVIGNHFSSKAAPDACRDAQAAFVRDRVAEIEAGGGEALVAGDLNAFEDETPLGVLEGPETSLDNLWDTAPAGEAYSFQFNGRLQTLDHALVTDGLSPLVRRFQYAHISNDYFQRSGATDGHAATDHDPAVVTLSRVPILRG